MNPPLGTLLPQSGCEQTKWIFFKKEKKKAIRVDEPLIYVAITYSNA